MSYVCMGKKNMMNHCADFIMEKYMYDGYQVQKVPFEEQGNEGILVQIRNTENDFSGILKTVIGCKKCVSVKLLHVNGNVDVKVMTTSWLDKAVVMTVAWFCLWPLLATGGFGIYQQKKLIDQVQQDVTNFLANYRR